MIEKKDAINLKVSILKAVRIQLECFPESSLKDIYKSFFQDEFGPGHLLENPEQARAYFEQELDVMKSQGRSNVEPCGRGLRFYRIPMDLIKDGVINAEDYFSAFTTGSSEFAIPDIDEWKKKWSTILTILESLHLRINSFENDSSEILKALKRNDYIMHHSSKYRNLYDPHYRIFSKHCLPSF